MVADTGEVGGTGKDGEDGAIDSPEDWLDSTLSFEALPKLVLALFNGGGD